MQELHSQEELQFYTEINGFDELAQFDSSTEHGFSWADINKKREEPTVEELNPEEMTPLEEEQAPKKGSSVLGKVLRKGSAVLCIGAIAYESDLPHAEQVVRELCAKLPTMYPEIFPVEPQYLGVDALNDHSVDMKVVATVDEANIFTARRLLNRELFLTFQQNGIEIPFMQQVVTMKK